MAYGKKVWIFPDAELPPVGVNIIPGHESIIITNTADQDAHIRITLFYTDKEPVTGIEATVGARRVSMPARSELTLLARRRLWPACPSSVRFVRRPRLSCL